MDAPKDPQTEWARLVVRSFAEAGVRDVVVSPGARVVPFVLALAAEPRLRVHDVVDERAAAFFALGQARLTGRPSLLMCTSGSAPAHYLPAVIEAKHSLTPLLVLSADRAVESHRCGAQQTIEQVELYGDQVLDFYDLAFDPNHAALRAQRRMIAQAVATSLGPTAGPVHVNVRARRPLEPRAPLDPFEAQVGERVRSVADAPMLQVTVPRLAPAVEPLRALAQRMAREERGVLALGPEPSGPADPALNDALLRLARRTGYPILRQPISMGPKSGAPHLLGAAASVLLAGPKLRASLAPSLVVQFGLELVAAPYEATLAEHADCRLEIVCATSECDAASRASVVHHGDVATALATLHAELDALAVQRNRSPWLERWTRLDRAANDALRNQLELRSADDEIATVGAFVRAMATAGSGAPLYVGNSLPVREVGTAMSWVDAGPLRFVHQRGASGIDGASAAAAGMASVCGPTAALIGDVTLLHDLHGLLVAGQSQAPLLVAVLANGAGRIFDQIAVGLRPDLAPAMHHFNTPVAPDFASLAKFCRGHHVCVDQVNHVESAVHAALVRPGLTLLELRVGPHSAAQHARALPQLIDDALAHLLEPTP
jgi:2-succinyl-5-enolpyruvyl-6-hydroxy-3-cyclohexene-1-carboxylate synthase